MNHIKKSIYGLFGIVRPGKYTVMLNKYRATEQVRDNTELQILLDKIVFEDTHYSTTFKRKFKDTFYFLDVFNKERHIIFFKKQFNLIFNRLTLFMLGMDIGETADELFVKNIILELKANLFMITLSNAGDLWTNQYCNYFIIDTVLHMPDNITFSEFRTIFVIKNMFKLEHLMNEVKRL